MGYTLDTLPKEQHNAEVLPIILSGDDSRLRYAVECAEFVSFDSPTFS